MRKAIRYLPLQIAISIFIFSQATFATKCFLKTDLAGLKEIFPIVFRGEVLERNTVKGSQSDYTLKIKVVEVIKGKLKPRNVDATEISEPQIASYEIGKEYFFPMSKRPNEKKESVHIPAIGCPALPRP